MYPLLKLLTYTPIYFPSIKVRTIIVKGFSMQIMKAMAT